MPPASKRPRSATRRQEILSTAADLFWANGYDATTMSELAATLGIQKPSLYHHVDKKEVLLYELSVDSLVRVAETAKKATESTSDPVERLRAIMEAHLETMLRDRSKHATMLMERRSLPDKERDEVTRLRDAYDSLLDDAIKAGQDAGMIRSDFPAKILRLTLLNMLNWTIFWFQPNGKASSKQLGSAFAEIFLGGAGPRGGEHAAMKDLPAGAT